MSLGMILMIVFLVLLIGALPAWPHSRNWNYYPSSGVGVLFLILLFLVLTNRI